MKRPPGPDFRQKRIDSQRLTIRDMNNNCRVSGVFNINNETKMIVMTSNKNVYLIDCKRKITKISMKKWKEIYRYEIDDKGFASIWDKSIFKKLKEIKKKETVVRRNPVKKMKRTPAIKRTPMKKKIKRRPAK